MYFIFHSAFINFQTGELDVPVWMMDKVRLLLIVAIPKLVEYNSIQFKWCSRLVAGDTKHACPLCGQMLCTTVLGLDTTRVDFAIALWEGWVCVKHLSALHKSLVQAFKDKKNKKFNFDLSKKENPTEGIAKLKFSGPVCPVCPICIYVCSVWNRVIHHPFGSLFSLTPRFQAKIRGQHRRNPACVGCAWTSRVYR